MTVLNVEFEIMSYEFKIGGWFWIQLLLFILYAILSLKGFMYLEFRLWKESFHLPKSILHTSFFFSFSFFFWLVLTSNMPSNLNEYLSITSIMSFTQTIWFTFNLRHKPFNLTQIYFSTLVDDLMFILN